jgi:hypothetical protein
VDNVPFPRDYVELINQAKEAVEMALKDEKQLMVSFVAMVCFKMDVRKHVIFRDPKEPFYRKLSSQHLV